MYRQFAVVFDKPQFAEAIHKEVDPRPGRAHHLRQRFLAYFRNYRLGRAFLAELGKKQKRPGKALFTRIEKLVNQVRLYANVAGKQILYKNVRERMMLMERTYHFMLFDLQYSTGRQGNRSGHAQWLPAGNAFLPQKVLGAQQGNCGFLASRRDHLEFDLATLNIKHGSRWIALGENILTLFKFNNFLPKPACDKKLLGSKSLIALAGALRTATPRVFRIRMAGILLIFFGIEPSFRGSSSVGREQSALLLLF